MGGHENANAAGSSASLGGAAGASAGSANAAAGAAANGAADQGGSSSAGGSAGGSAGSPAMGGSLSVSSGGMGMLRGVCEGPFKAPSPQILSPQSPPSNLSITGDELELFFNAANVVSSYERASTGVLFPDPAPVAELGNVCGALSVGGMDVTLDGLRLYIACSDDAGGFMGPLRLATRTDRQSAFTLTEKALGTVGNSISISKDELELFAVTEPGNGYVMVYRRASLDEPFGAGKLVEGLAGPFRYPEISSDGLNLFGVAGPSPGRLVVATRGAPSGSFSSPTSDGLPAPVGNKYQYTPTVSEACRLYYLAFGTPGGANTIDLLAH